MGYILDEPEAALSPIRQMSLISRMDELVKGGQTVYNCDAFADFDGVSEEFYIWNWGKYRMCELWGEREL